tara:strand:+ start:13 stop:486 length:474 start_codon:yes stop_codon:yes gene_type:complete
MLIAGIDPGTNGAIAVLDSENPDSVDLLDLKKKNTSEIFNWSRLHTWNTHPHVIWIEDVHSMHGMSAKSNFGFGKNVGMITTIAELTWDEVKTVTPKIWQKYLGVTVKGKAIKKEVAKIAQDLYPNAELYGQRGGLLDGRADALMIAHYGLKHMEEK